MKTLFRLRTFLKPYWAQVLLALTITLIATAMQLVVPVIIQQVIDVGLAQGEVQFIIQAALVLLTIGGVRALLIYSQRYLSEWIATHIGYDLRNRLYDHIQHLPFSYHDHTQTGQLISRVIEDVRAVERFTGFGVIELIRVGILLVGISTLLLSQQPRLALITMTPIAILMFITIRFGSRIGGYFMDVDVSLGELSAHLQENVSGAQVVRAFARENYEIDRFQGYNRTLYNTRVRVISFFSRVMPTSLFLVSISTILVLWFGGNMVIAGEMTIGELTAFNSYLLLLAMPARQLAWLVNIAGEAVAGLRRNLEVLDLEPEITSPAGAISLPKLSGQIEFRDVCFQYQQQNIPALNDINLQVASNQVIALIGPTGSGKTSLVNLIPRFYDPSLGTVLVDGTDIRQAELTSLRRQIGIVLQTSLLFSVTIAENIAYGYPQASQEEIEAAARAAQAHEFIIELPEGYDTVVGERGITLSGGQRQRVAIARAILMDPRILILDDSTSSVDTETEQMIQKALDHLMQGRTTFVIAHRLSTVRRADLILVMKDGHILERGAHDELLSCEGLYREIYDLQLRDQQQYQQEISELPAREPVRIGRRSTKNWEEDS